MRTKPIYVLENIFTQLITVQSISNPTQEETKENAEQICRDKNYDVCLVKNSGNSNPQVYVNSDSEVKNLDKKKIISHSTPLIEALHLLLVHKWLFIEENQSITSIVTRADRDSIPVRIWLFGMISLMEKQIREKIQKQEIVWDELISKDRFLKAQELFQNKWNDNEEIDLLSCTQLIDLSSIIRKNRNKFFDVFDQSISNTILENKFKKLEKLRNQLAHSNPIQMPWENILELMKIIKHALKTMEI
jgi:hypothetical protein